MLTSLKPFAFFLGGSAFVAMLATLIGNTHPAFLVLICLVILLAGLPHGAFDYYILSARYTGPRFVFALVVYLALIGMTVMLWWLLPLWFWVASSPTPPITSATQTGRIREPCGNGSGLSLVGLPCLLTPQAVQPLFAVIAGVTEISLLTKVTGLLSIPATIPAACPIGSLREGTTISNRFFC